MKRIFVLVVLLAINLAAQTAPKVLLVTAHPDDETGAAVTIYKITHELKGKVDLALITNGEGGYKYSTLAEDIYGAELTNEKTGREMLPTIRKRELMNGGKILGIRNYYFFDQKDTKYTLDMTEVLNGAWNLELIRTRLKEIILNGKYDYIFCLTPVPETHAHHKAATILALQTLAAMDKKDRPTILACNVSQKNDTIKFNFHELADYGITRITNTAEFFRTDRTAAFGFKKRLNYKVIANWVIAEHKSQGTMQLYMNGGDYEDFYMFDLNEGSRAAELKKLFEELKKIPYPEKEYQE